MTIHEMIRGGVLVIAPDGRLTVETEDDIRTAVRRAFDNGRSDLVLDLAAVPYIDSCGLGTIAQTYVAAFKRGGLLKLANVNGRNRRLLTITKLLTVFDVFDNVDDAIGSFTGRRASAAADLGDPPAGPDRKLSTMAASSLGYT